MKKLVFLIITCFSLSIPNLAICGESTGNANFFLLGTKQLDRDDWEPIDKHDEIGILLDFKQKNWPVSMAIGYLSSYDSGTTSAYFPDLGTVTFYLWHETTELSFGIKKIWDGSPSLRPYIGCGLALISMEAEVTGYFPGMATTVSDNDTAMGFWIGAGVYFTVAESSNIGFNLRFSQAEVTMFGGEFEAGGTHYGLLLGFHW